MLIFNVSLIIAVKLKGKYRFHVVAILEFFILQHLAGYTVI
jgi:hypothetical protein